MATGFNDHHPDEDWLDDLERPAADAAAGGPSESEADNLFMQLLAEHQVRLRAYIFVLVRDASDADDIAQQTFLVMWKKRTSYDPTRDFFAWACGVARIEVLMFRRSRATDRLQFDETLINTLAVEYLEHADACDRRRGALLDCLTKLPDGDRRLLQVRYTSDAPVAEIATQLGRPLSTVYRMLAKIRESLFQCVQRSVAQQLR